MGRQYRVTLSEGDVARLKEAASAGRESKAGRYAMALLLLDRGEFAEYRWTVARVSRTLGVSDRTLSHVKERFLRSGMDAALFRGAGRRPARPSRFASGAEEALLELASSPPPEGHARWTLRLLAEKAVEAGVAGAISHMSVWRILRSRGAGAGRDGGRRGPGTGR